MPEQEIELKLLTTAPAGAIIDKHLLPQLNAEVKHDVLHLANYYFDTPQQDFRQQRMGLRVRGEQILDHLADAQEQNKLGVGHNQLRFEQTIKTAGLSFAGLAQRPEYNVALPYSADIAVPRPNLALFPSDIWPERVDLPSLQQQLGCIFYTHFVRHRYALQFHHGSAIELVWDKGEVVADGKTDVISELELELKEGKVADLFWLAQQLLTYMPLTLGSLSKAARGYALLATEPQKTISANSQDLKVKGSLSATKQLTKLLKAWQSINNELALAINLKQIQRHIEAVQLILNNVCEVLSIVDSNDTLCDELTNLAEDWQVFLSRQTQSAVLPMDNDKQTLINNSTKYQLKIMQTSLELPD
ncbi:MAG: CYTH domain-containing protein [Paraglaciecola sp.]|nr:CYTH domain-containing protein [Paraglaciecola sp.]NCT47958.1 CYTH domain-containing protein [Paraglaciecola sp.]